MNKTAIPVSVLLVLALGSASPAAAADLGKLQKAYFSGTKPGSFAKYEQTTTDAKGKVSVSISTISRLENEGNRIWFEIRMEPKSGGKQKASTMKYLLKEDFKVEKNALNYFNYIDRIIMQEDGGQAQELPMETFRTLGSAFVSNVDYGSDVTPKGTDTVDGKSCDRYGLSGKFEFKVVFMTIKGTYEGDLWLNDSVPFGRVKESTVTKDDKGSLTSKSESKLLETGTGATSRIKGPVQKVDLPKMFN